MAASTSYSSAADSNSNYGYDVFLNHRGPDVKKTFASHLYRRLISYGLRVFLDYQELQEGEGLTCQIQGAITTASVHVAIFSPTYAESQWCLDELVLMLESRAPIIPVFHHVKPTEVRRTREEEVYGLALRNLENKRTRDFQPRYNSSRIDNWRKALSLVAEISGLDLEAFNGDEGALVDKVVERVLKKVQKPRLHVAKYPTGLDEKVKDLVKTVLLQQHSRSVQFVGIAGLGGVGKTTLAKELFNRKSSNYSRSCFLFDVRENAKISLLSLQKKLMKSLTQLDLQIDSIDEGIEMLTKHLSRSSPQVLVVLDDVDDVDQVDALLPVRVKDILNSNSLIMITSRDKNVLARSGVKESSIYMLTGLNTERSRELFCSHAFCQLHPPSGFQGLVYEFLNACHGLPLSLKVFGGLLYGNTDKSLWKDQLDRLQQILPVEIQRRLQISYDSLSRDEQQIFLDIACFFIGKNKDTAVRIWEASGWKGLLGFKSLQNKCLVEVDLKNNIRMHEYLRDLGRTLADDSRLPRRLWRGRGSIDDLLQQSSAVTEVRGIRIRLGEYDDEYNNGFLNLKYIKQAVRKRIRLGEQAVRNRIRPREYEEVLDDKYESFSCYKMRKLQLLDIPGDLSERILRSVHSPNLIWLSWAGFPWSSLPSWIPMKNLRVLEMSNPKLETLWQDKLRAPLQLQELHILNAHLLNIPKSIGQLKHLERIVVTAWPMNSKKNFEKLPDEFCHLSSLKHLQLTGFLWSLPDFFGNLTNLEHIDLSNSKNLERLPDSFGNLIRLKYLDLNGCFNLSLSRGSFGNISTLEYIDLTGCDKIEVLPSQIAHQRSLEKLYLELRNLKEWPSAIGQPSGLEELVLKTPLLETLPPSLGRDLRNLKHLTLTNCKKLKHLQDSVGLLKQLSQLTVKDCSFSLRELFYKTVEAESEKLTESRGQRTSSNLDGCLFRLSLHNLEISELPFATGVCPNLQRLLIKSCNGLLEVETLPNALIKLELTGCSKLRKIEGLAHLTKLQELDVSGCSEMEELPCVHHLTSLEKLRVSKCVKLSSIGDLAQLTQLLELDISGCCELEKLQAVEHLTSMEKLQVRSCENLKSIGDFGLLTKLRELDVSHCFELEALTGVEYLSSLERLQALNCVKLKSIRWSAQQTRLKELDVSYCSELEELPGVGHLRSLEVFRASECVKLNCLRELDRLTKIRDLDITRVPMRAFGFDSTI